MKKYCIAFILFFTFGLLLGSMVAAKTTSMSTYYPSSSGAYTSVVLMNGANGPNEHYPYCFCAINSGNASGTKAGACDTGEVGVTYSNAGSIFTDQTTGYMEICKNDGSYSSYVGACLNRFCTGAGCTSAANACPTNYLAVANSGTPFTNVTSYSCCFSNGAGHYAKTGCFSVYSPDGLSQPANCYSVDSNSYDMGCQGVGVCGSVRTCCFNSGSQTACGGGPCTLSALSKSTCPPSPPCACLPGSTTACTGSCGGTMTCNAAGTAYGACSSSGSQCQAATACTNASSCDVNGNCPAPTNKPDGTLCLPAPDICRNGVCQPPCIPNSTTSCGSGACLGTMTCNAAGTAYGACSSSGSQCQAATACTNASSCDSNGNCPAATNVADGTTCPGSCSANGCPGTKACSSGACTGCNAPTKDACSVCGGSVLSCSCPCTGDVCQVQDACGQCGGTAGSSCGGCGCTGDVCNPKDACGVCGGDGSTCCTPVTCPSSPGHGCVTPTCCGTYESTFTVAAPPTCTPPANWFCVVFNDQSTSLCPGTCTLTSVTLLEQDGVSTCEKPGDVCTAVYNGACNPLSDCWSTPTCHMTSYSGNCGQTCPPNCSSGCTGPGGTCCVPSCSGCSTNNYSDGCNGTCYANCYPASGDHCSGSQCCSSYGPCWTPS